MDELPKNAKLIPGMRNSWATPDGKFYGKYNGKYFERAQQINKTNGYKYVSLLPQNGPRCSYRAHRKIAETFISNPNNLPVVGHKNNIKTDNRVENLYWTTYSENTQKAVQDKLLKNDKGAEDSQSLGVSMYDTYTNKKLGDYGSAREAARLTNRPLTTILRQCRYKRPIRTEVYFRFASECDSSLS